MKTIVRMMLLAALSLSVLPACQPEDQAPAKPAQTAAKPAPQAQVEAPKVSAEALAERYNADLTALKKALDAYYAEKKAYPVTFGRWDGLYSAWGESKADWIPGLAPKYIAALPRDPRQGTDPTRQYIFKSDGQDYKLIAHNVDENAVKILVGKLGYAPDPARGLGAIGYWTSKAAAW